MSAVPETQNTQSTEQKPAQNDKEYNFAQIRGQLEREKQEKIQLREEVEKLKAIAQERLKPPESDDDDDDDEPYIDKKRLKKELGKAVRQTVNDTDTRIDKAVKGALAEERKKQWLKSNPDFDEVMQHAQTFADKDPELAETILEMPESFERYKLVYKNIKALGLHKKPEEKSGIQDKIDQNKRTPYYQPTGIASPGYANVVLGRDVSPTEGKSAYAKMKELQARMRI